MKILIFLILTILSALVYPQSKLVITGVAPMLKTGTEVRLVVANPRYNVGIKKPALVKKIIDHRFRFDLDVSGGEIYQLFVDKYYKNIFLGPGKANIIIRDSILKDVTIANNTASFEYDKYSDRESSDSLITEYQRARVKYSDYMLNNNRDSLQADYLSQRLDQLKLANDAQIVSLNLGWITGHPGSYINTMLLYKLIKIMPEERLQHVFMSMADSIKQNSYGRELRYQIDSLFVGSTAPNFSQADSSGRQVSLSSFRGRYLLLDFWASWCIPCRRDNPNIVKAMQLYGDKNFTVLSISVDEKRKNWVQAIRSDNLNWTHVSNLQGWKNPVVEKYFVSLIPANYLIDPDGRIIAKNLHGKDLFDTLNKLLQNVGQ